MTVLQVDSTDPTPPFEQIRRQLAFLIDSGELSVGQRLPTVRQLAADLQVAPGTVSRAFKELEAAGYVETRRAAGTRVRAPQATPTSSQSPSSSTLTQLADDYVRHALATGADASLALDAVRQAFARRPHPDMTRGAH